MLNADLSIVMGDVSQEDSQRLNIAWHDVLRPYLRTPRDVRADPRSC
jgi:hypothetical protein